MVNIKLDDEFSLVTDSRQWMICRGDVNRFEYLTFHTTLEHAIESYFERKIRSSNARSISGLVEYHKRLVRALNRVLQPLKIKVIQIKEEDKKDAGERNGV